jgi:hypothetical protein
MFNISILSLTEFGQRRLQFQNCFVLEQAHNLIVLEAVCADAIHSCHAVTCTQSIAALYNANWTQAADAGAQTLVPST